MTGDVLELGRHIESRCFCGADAGLEGAFTVGAECYFKSGILERTALRLGKKEDRLCPDAEVGHFEARLEERLFGAAGQRIERHCPDRLDMVLRDDGTSLYGGAQTGSGTLTSDFSFLANPIGDVERFPVKIEETERHVCAVLSGDFADKMRLDHSIPHEERQQHRRIEAPRLILQELPRAVVVEARPAHGGPYIVELPEERAHAARHRAPPEFYRSADRHRLLDLGEIDELTETLGHPEIPQHGVDDEAVAAGMLLVGFEDGRADIAPACRGEAGDGPHRGQGLEAELGTEARPDCEVLGEGPALVPHRPEVHVAPLVRVPVVRKIVRARGGARGPETAVGVEAPDDPSQHSLGEPVVVDDIARGVLFRFLVPGDRAERLVVAAPQGDAGMVGELFDLPGYFGLHVGEKFRARGVQGAGEHAVLPQHDAALVAEFVEIVALVASAAPDTEAVHVRRGRGVEETGGALSGPARGEGVGGNPVCALGEDFSAVHHELESAADAVLFGGDFEFAKAYPFVDDVGARRRGGRVGCLRRALHLGLGACLPLVAHPGCAVRLQGAAHLRLSVGLKLGALRAGMWGGALDTRRAVELGALYLGCAARLERALHLRCGACLEFGALRRHVEIVESGLPMAMRPPQFRLFDFHGEPDDAGARLTELFRIGARPAEAA